MGEEKPVRPPAGLGLLAGEENSVPFHIGPKTCQEKNQREAREQQKLRETNRNLQKPPETIRQLDFRRRNSREKSTPYTALASPLPASLRDIGASEEGDKAREQPR